jgi:hypothetical protein
MGEIVGMSVDDAIEYGGLLLAQSEDQWATYLGLYQQKQDLSGQIAENFYTKDAEELASQMRAATDEMNGKIADKLSELEGVGFNSGGLLGDGLLDGLKAKEAEMLEECRRLSAELASSFDFGSASERFAAVDARAFAYSPLPATDANSQAAAIVNGVGTLLAGNQAAAPAGAAQDVIVQLDGQTLGRVLLPYSRAAGSQSPQITMGY